MDRHVLGLRDQPAVEVADRGREVAARIEDLRIGGAQHRLAHLLDDRQEAMLDDRCYDRIDTIYQGCHPSIASAPQQRGARMPYRPNYRLQRTERDRVKKAKKE